MVGQGGVRRIRRHGLGQVQQWLIARQDPPSDPSMNLGNGPLNRRGDKTIQGYLAILTGISHRVPPGCQ